MLLKNLAAQLEDVSVKDGLVTHYWSAFGNRDSDGDVIQRGAYAKTIQERGPQGANRIKFLWQHDPWDPIGVPVELAEDERGLRAVTKIPATTRGRDALILYEEGVLTEHSVGIDVLRRADADQAVIEEVRLWEGSVVTWGANPLTPFLGLKGEHAEAAWRRIEGQMAAARKALRKPLTDETAEKLETWLGVHEAQLQELRKTLRKGEVYFLTEDEVRAYAPASQQTPPDSGTSGDGAPRDEAEALQLLINALG